MNLSSNVRTSHFGKTPFHSCTFQVNEEIQDIRKYNKNLSQKRAKEVKSFLVQQGIEAERITAIGYGSSRPLIDCSEEMDECSDEIHQKNRRTEIILTPGR